MTCFLVKKNAYYPNILHPLVEFK